nr:hypothetical protein [Tanacetum cinerariifolium]
MRLLFSIREFSSVSTSLKDVFDVFRVKKEKKDSKSMKGNREHTSSNTYRGRKRKNTRRFEDEEITEDKDLPTPVHCFGHNSVIRIPFDAILAAT